MPSKKVKKMAKIKPGARLTVRSARLAEMEGPVLATKGKRLKAHEGPMLETQAKRLKTHARR